jgi:aspartyl-tRNA(Asn)/glutamyl-tRNA(Gln) amidotransferase subunit A
MLQPIAGYDPKDVTTVKREVPLYKSSLNGDINGVRVGLPINYFYDRANPEVEKIVRAAAEKLAELGAKVEEMDIPQIEHAGAAALTIYLAEATAYHDDRIAKDRDLYSEQVRGYLELGNYVLAKDYLHAQRYRTLLCRNMADVFKKVDVLLMPTTPVTATKIGQEAIDIRGVEETVFGALLRNTEPFNLTGSPALALPCGFSGEGLPVSMQLAGRPFDEITLLRVGDSYQQATDWHREHPKL